MNMIIDWKEYIKTWSCFFEQDWLLYEAISYLDWEETKTINQLVICDL